jgi:hypothetical protein
MQSEGDPSPVTVCGDQGSNGLPSDLTQAHFLHTGIQTTARRMWRSQLDGRVMPGHDGEGCAGSKMDSGFRRNDVAGGERSVHLPLSCKF